MITGVLVTAVFAAPVYTDVKEGKWFYDAVMEAYEKELMFGSDGKFRPNDTMNRAEMVTLISRLAGVDLDGYKVTKKFKDVGMTSWYTPVVCWASDSGLVGGYDDNTFKPTAPVKRQELAKMIVGLIDYLDAFVPDSEDAAEPFKDFSKIQSWAKDYVEALRKTGLVKGDDKGNFNPSKTATRAEVATIAVRLRPYLEGDLTLNQIVAKLKNETCGAHNCLHVEGGYTADLTAENLAADFIGWMGIDADKYSVEVDPEAVVEFANNVYAGAGFGDDAQVDVEFRLTDKETGEATGWNTIKLSIQKYPDGAGAMMPCPDDKVPDQILENLENYFDLDDDGRLKLPLAGGASFTRENISEKILTKVGLDPRCFRVNITDNSTDSFDDAKTLHSGLCHGQVHDEEFCLTITHLPDLAWFEAQEREDALEKASTEEYTWRFWISKDCTTVYDTALPAEAIIPFSGDELTKEALDKVIHDYLTEISSMNNDYVNYEYDFDALVAEHNGGKNSVEVHIAFVQPTAFFTYGNMAGLPDLRHERTYTISFAG